MGGGVGQQWPTAGLGALSVAVHAGDLLKEVAIIFIQFSSVAQSCPTLCNSMDGLQHTRHLHYLHHSLASGQITGRECSPTHQQKIGLKIYRAWHHTSEQDPVFPIRKLP